MCILTFLKRRSAVVSVSVLEHRLCGWRRQTTMPPDYFLYTRKTFAGATFRDEEIEKTESLRALKAEVYSTYMKDYAYDGTSKASVCKSWARAWLRLRRLRYVSFAAFSAWGSFGSELSLAIEHKPCKWVTTYDSNTLSVQQ